MKVSDLNIDCLEGILNYLPLNDLLNGHAAEFIYVRKYSKQELSFDPTFEPNSISMADNRLSFKDLKNSLRMLRCFGHLVSKLKYHHEKCFYSIEYIQKYCSETLKEFEIFFRGNPCELKMLKKPFTVVESFTLYAGCADCLVWLFPKMRKLRISPGDCQFVHKECIANHFPHLESLEIFDICLKKCEFKCTEVYRNILQLNPQLKFLRLFHNNIDMNFFQSISGTLQNLEHLDVLGFWKVHENFNGQIMHLKNVKYFEWYSAVIPFSFDQLESLNLFMINQPIEYYFTSFERNQSIKKLTLHINNEDKVDLLIKNQTMFTKSLPFLEEFQLFVSIDLYLSIDTVLHILDAFAKLTFLQFRLLGGHLVYHFDLQQRLKVDWSSS